VVVAALAAASAASAPDRQWLPGDTHIHSHWSAGADRRWIPPVPLKGQDALYSTPRNAVMARQFGLRWMVTTDHGGPDHAKLNFLQAHRELTLSRELVPEMLQFYGMELNMPGMDHHTLIIPNAADEATVLREFEGQFDANQDWALPPDPRRNSAATRRRALAHLQALERLPVLFANHPSRSATAVGAYGLDEPWELRANNDLAPDVYRGMEGAPGHQAATLAVDGSLRPRVEGRRRNARGRYQNPDAPTMGGFDQMTAIVGGLWDSFLGEGRRFWIVASSDSHAHYSDPARPGVDFWPGEFHKTYVRARPTYEDVLDGLRQGRVFAVAGDLVSTLDVTARGGGQAAELGDTLTVAASQAVEVTIAFRDPDVPNGSGENPTVRRVDLIVGDIVGPASDPSLDRNPTTEVLARLDRSDWVRDGDRYTVTTTVPASASPRYIRVRGTGTDLLEPRADTPDENPWDNLWFYSNPIFIAVD
jgi:hypothetical protein